MRFIPALSIVAFALVAIAPRASAQAGYEPGGFVVSGSVGSGVSGLYGIADMPLIALSVERGITDEFSAGGSIGVASSTYDYGFGSDYSWTVGYTIVAARGSYHLNEWFDVDNLDLYAGGSLGYNVVSVKEKAGSASSSAVLGSYLLYGAHVGGRYFFTPKIAGFAEVGYGLGNVAAGLSMRF